MAHDPVVHVGVVWVQRALLFILLVPLVWAVVFWTVLYEKCGLGLSAWRDVWQFWCASWPPAESSLKELLFQGSGIIALLLVTNIYLVIALLWKKRGDVYHRGAQFIDHRRA